MLKAQNVKTNNQYIIAVKCQESQRLFSKKKRKREKKRVRDSRLKTTIKKKNFILLGLAVVHCPKGPKPKARDTMHK